MVVSTGNLACDIASAVLVKDICSKIEKLGDCPLHDDAVTAAITQSFQECDLHILKEAYSIVEGNLISAAVPSAARQEPLQLCWNGEGYFQVVGKKPERGGSCAVVSVIRGREVAVAHLGYAKHRALLLSIQTACFQIARISDRDCRAIRLRKIEHSDTGIHTILKQIYLCLR